MRVWFGRVSWWLWLLSFAFGVLLIAPVAGVVLALSRDGQTGNWLSTLSSVFGERVLDLLTRTTARASAVAIGCTLLALGTDALLNRLPWRRVTGWLVAYVFGFLLSPYIYTMGWIGLIGTDGALWKWLRLGQAPFSIYSNGGVVAMLVMSNFPIAVVLIHLSGRLFPAKFGQTAGLLQFSMWERFRYVTWMRVRAGVGASLIWGFILAFWAYDIPSMLRQNSYALEVLAAFGSFYDYLRAVLLALPLVSIVLVLAVFSWRFFSRENFNPREWRSVGHQSDSSRGGFLVYVLLAIPLAGWVVPLLGLFAQIRSIDGFLTSIHLAKGDIWNTLIAGSSSAAMATSLSFLVAFGARVTGRAYLFRGLAVVSLLLVALPGIFAGIGFVYLFNLPFLQQIRAWRIELPLVQTSVTLPVIFLGALVLCQTWSRAWTQTAMLHRIPLAKQISRIALPVLGPGIGLLAIFAFCLAIREVPASLLNYPPNGATLAITIDTMLHFDQPQAVASFCLVQFAIAAAVVLPAYFWIRKLV